jgi:hypothetical protein
VAQRFIAAMTGGLGSGFKPPRSRCRSFARFGQELHGIQQGARNDAVLKAVAEMLELRLQGNSRKLQAELKIREYIAPHVATLTSTLEVDYDLFVNKLVGEFENFVSDLRLLEPDEVG